MANIIVTAIGAFILIVVLAIFLSGIKILKEWERAPVLTLGRYRGLKGPGVIYVVPFISRVPFVISTRLQAMAFKTEQTLTKDNVPVVVDAVMYFQPVDFEKVVLGAENYALATQFAAQTTLREVIGQVSFDEILSEREKIGARVREIIDSKTEAWGIKVVATEIRDVIIPPALQEAMSRQAQAERERRARVTLAIAEYEAAQKMTEAAKYYETNNIAFQLRWMNIIYELGLQGKNTIMLIPTNMPPVGVTGNLPPYGYFGVKDLAERAKTTEGAQPST
jgi:regulator of protease activity HflC (stomatin/prohibitin superfamily)